MNNLSYEATGFAQRHAPSTAQSAASLAGKAHVPVAFCQEALSGANLNLRGGDDYHHSGDDLLKLTDYLRSKLDNKDITPDHKIKLNRVVKHVTTQVNQRFKLDQADLKDARLARRAAAASARQAATSRSPALSQALAKPERRAATARNAAVARPLIEARQLIASAHAEITKAQELVARSLGHSHAEPQEALREAFKLYGTANRRLEKAILGFTPHSHIVDVAVQLAAAAAFNEIAKEGMVNVRAAFRQAR